MARLEYFLVSRSISIDVATNQVSIFEVIDEIAAASFPSQIPYLVATSLWCQEEGEEDRDFQLILRITTPGGSSHDLPTNFQIQAKRHRITQRLEGLRVEQEGTLHFEAILNGKHAAQIGRAHV